MGDRESAESLLNAVVEIGLNQLVGPRKAFINLDRQLLVGGYAESLPKDRVVLELLETVKPDKAVLKAIRGLSRIGFSFALDDFVYDPELDPFLKFAEIVKLDIRALGNERLVEEIKHLPLRGLKILAEKVETQDEYEFCIQQKFHYYQGFFLCRPKLVHGRRIPPNRLSVIRLLAKLQEPDVSFGEIENIVSRDVALSFKLLRIINSAFYALPKRVESLRQAIQFLGTRGLMALASLISLAGLREKPHELLITAMVRAKMCERLATCAKKDCPEKHFTVGLFSVLDALMDSPMEEVLQELPLSDDVNRALLESNTEEPLYRSLKCSLAYEQGEWESVEYEDLTREQITSAYLLAVQWATQTGKVMAA